MIYKENLTLFRDKPFIGDDHYRDSNSLPVLCWRVVWAFLGIYPGPKHINLPEAITVEWSGSPFKGSICLPLNNCAWGYTCKHPSLEKTYNCNGEEDSNFIGWHNVYSAVDSKLAAVFKHEVKRIYFKISLTPRPH